MKSITVLTAIIAVAQLTACVPASEDAQNAPGQDNGLSAGEDGTPNDGKADDGVTNNVEDYCAVGDEAGSWYGDGKCDDFCPKPDPDCDDLEYRTCSKFSGCRLGEYCHHDYEFDPSTSQESFCGGLREEGTCRPKPTECADHVHPYLGCDGNTYNNACEAAQAGVSIAKEGPRVAEDECASDGDCLVDEHCRTAVVGLDDNNHEIYRNSCARYGCDERFGACAEGQWCTPNSGNDGHDLNWECSTLLGDNEPCGTCGAGQHCIDYPVALSSHTWVGFRCEYTEPCGDGFGFCPEDQACLAVEPISGQNSDYTWACERVVAEGNTCGGDTFGTCADTRQTCTDFQTTDRLGRPSTGFHCE